MRTLVIVGVLAGTAQAGPVGRMGVVGGYDTSAPGHKEDGIALGAGYRAGGFTGYLDYAYFDYDGSTGVGGSATRLGVRLQAQLLSSKCKPTEATCPHLDLDAAVGRRFVRWEAGEANLDLLGRPPIERSGRELGIGISATFMLHFSLHYILFQQDPAPSFSCRGTCPMSTTGNDHGVLFEASFTLGGS